MDEPNRIKEAWDRMVRLLRKRPGAGRGTGITTVRLADGLRCAIEQGSWQVTADQPAEYGGGDAGPDPGFFGRAALGLCAAQGYAMALARHGLEHRGIEVRVESDMDARGSFGVADDVPVGYDGLRCFVTVDSDAAEAAILAALDEADRGSPWLYNFTTALPVARQVTLRQQVPGAGTSAA